MKTKIDWRTWEHAVCTMFGLEHRGRPGRAEADCECKEQTGSLVIDAKRKVLPDWIYRWHRKTCSYASPTQFPLTVFRGPAQGLQDDLVICRLSDFRKFVLPAMQERAKRGWW